MLDGAIPVGKDKLVANATIAARVASDLADDLYLKKSLPHKTAANVGKSK